MVPNPISSNGNIVGDEPLISQDSSIEVMAANKGASHLPIGLDKDCLSCVGTQSHTMQLFKLACIQY